jgi:hypothetical protein
VDERAAQAELLLHAARQLAGGTVDEGGEACGFRQLGNPPFTFGTGMAEQAGEKIDVLGHRERRVEIAAESLRHVGDARADAAAMTAAGHIAAQHLDAAGLQAARTCHQRQQARLADTIWADQSDDAAGREIEVDGIERGDGAVTQADGVQSGDEAGLLWAFRHGGSFTARLAGQSSLGSVRT